MKNPHVTFHIVSLFPEIFDLWFSQSVLGRKHKEGFFTIKTYQLREYENWGDESQLLDGVGKKKKVRIRVDDKPYGGGKGMIIRLPTLVAAHEYIEMSLKGGQKPKTIYFSPKGKMLNKKLLEEFHFITFHFQNQAQSQPQNQVHWILYCGHYEGIDQRFIDGWIDYEVSVGDFVVTGGEVPALMFVDAFVRLLSGVLQKEVVEEESFSIKDPEDETKNLLEYPQYTRPQVFRGQKVPPILLHGDHKAILDWKLKEAKKITKKKLDLE